MSTTASAARRCAALLGALLGLPAAAGASGFQLDTDAQALGSALAGSRVAEGDLGVVATNPAAMQLLEGTLAQVDVSLIDLGLRFRGAGQDALGAPLRGDGGGNAGGLLAVPSTYLSTPLGTRARLGLSLTSPFGLATEYGAGFVGRYQALRSELTTVDLAAAASFRASDQLALGASLIHQSLTAELSRAIDFGALLGASPLLPPGLFAPQSADGRVTLRADDQAWGAALGLLWSPSAGTRVGLAYRTRIEHTLEGEVRYAVPASVAPILAAGGVTRFADTRGRADLNTPALASVSLSRALGDRLTLLAEATLTQWSALSELRLRSANGAPDTVDVLDWHDTWFSSLGADYRASEALTLRAGIGYDQTPTRTAHRSPSIPDSARRWLALGLSWQFGQTGTLHAGYMHLFPHSAALRDRSATGSTLDGSVVPRVDVLAVSLSWGF